MKIRREDVWTSGRAVDLASNIADSYHSFQSELLGMSILHLFIIDYMLIEIVTSSSTTLGRLPLQILDVCWTRELGSLFFSSSPVMMQMQKAKFAGQPIPLNCFGSDRRVSVDNENLRAYLRASLLHICF
jgi:hypothetical protein